MPEALDYAASFKENTGERICREYEHLRKDRGTWESHWQEISERIWPMTQRSFSPDWFTTPGNKRNEKVFDSTAALALTRFGAILDSLLTPSSQTWHNLRASDPKLNKRRDIQLYFEEVNRLLMFYRYGAFANFPGQNQFVYKSLGAYGTGAMFIDDLIGQPGIRYKALFLGQIYFAENHQNMVDKAARPFRLTCRQAYQKWGDKLSKELIEKGKKDPEALHLFLQFVEPRTEGFDPERKDFRGMPHASYYVEYETKKLIEEGGYSSFPFIVPRYEQGAEEVYGRGPAMDALPAIKTLNEQKKTFLKQGHRAIDPVLLAHDDGVADGFSFRPGALNIGGVNADGRALVHALPVGQISMAPEMMKDERETIKDFFLVSLFQLLRENPQMTATEVLEKTREKGILLAPTIVRQNSEYLGPMLDREIDILSKQNLLPRMPEALREAGGRYTVQYDSPITRAQRAERASGLFTTLQSVLPIVQATSDPTPLDYFNWDEITPDVSDINGIPPSWMRSKEEVAAMRAQRDMQAQQQQMIDAAPGAAAMLNSVAKVQAPQ